MNIQVWIDGLNAPAKCIYKGRANHIPRIGDEIEIKDGVEEEVVTVLHDLVRGVVRIQVRAGMMLGFMGIVWRVRYDRCFF